VNSTAAELNPHDDLYDKKNVIYFLGIVATLALSFIIFVELYALIILPQDFSFGIIVFAFLLFLHLKRWLLPKIVSIYQHEPEVRSKIIGMQIAVNLISILLAVSAFNQVLDKFKIAQVNNNPALMQANSSYQSAKRNYDDLVSGLSRNRDELVADINKAQQLQQQQHQFRTNAEALLKQQNAQWQADFDAYMATTKKSGVALNKLTNATFNNSFACTAKLSTFKKSYGQPYTRLSTEICRDLNASYPKPKSLNDVADMGHLDALQQEAQKYSQAQIMLSQLDMARSRLDTQQQYMLSLRSQLLESGNSLHIFEDIAKTTGFEVSNVEDAGVIGFSFFMYFSLTFLYSTRTRLAKNEIAKPKKSNLSAYTHKFLVRILTHNRKINIALIVASIIVITIYVAFLAGGWILAIISGAVVGLVSYFILEYYPLKELANDSISNLGNVTVTTPDFSDLMPGLEKAAQNVAKSLRKVTPPENVTEGSDNKVTPKKPDENVTKRYDNPQVTKVTVPQNHNDNVANWFQNPFSPSFATAEQTLQIGDNVTAEKATAVKTDTQLQGVGFLATEVPKVSIPDLYDEWCKLFANGVKATTALRQLENRYGLVKGKINQGYATKWRKLYEAEQEATEE